MKRIGTGRFVRAPVPFIEGGLAVGLLVVVDIHYKAEASHDGRQQSSQIGSSIPSWDYTALLDC